ncbi:ISPsy3, transposase, partial [Pseudomonas syringae pv. actinidiae ICMP 19102]
MIRRICEQGSLRLQIARSMLLQMSPAYTPRPLKNLFTANQCWAHLIEEGGLRDIEVESVTKMLACGTSILGVKHYTCGNDSCPHV